MVGLGERLLRRGHPRPDDARAWLARLTTWFDRYDVLLCPTIARPAPPIGWATGVGFGRTYLNGAHTVPYTPAWNIAGYPALSLPMPPESGQAGWPGRPGAVQIVAPAGGDGTVLALAVELEGSLSPGSSDR
jgi:amidase